MTQKKLNIFEALRIQKKVKNCTEKLINVWVRWAKPEIENFLGPKILSIEIVLKIEFFIEK